MKRRAILRSLAARFQCQPISPVWCEILSGVEMYPIPPTSVVKTVFGTTYIYTRYCPYSGCYFCQIMIMKYCRQRLHSCRLESVFVGSTCVRGPATGDSFSLYCALLC